MPTFLFDERMIQKPISYCSYSS